MKKTSFNASVGRMPLLLAASLAWATCVTPPVAGAEPPRMAGVPVRTPKASVERPTDAQPIDVRLEWGEVQLVVYKSQRRMALYRSGNFEKEFPVVLGLEPEGRKRHADDARTPEGHYQIVGKRRHDRWQHFLSIDYPNAADRASYDEELRMARIPDENGKPFAIGDSVGIHGNDRKDDLAGADDWTKGCVALRKADIAEVARRVPVGTPVWIVK